MGHVVAIKLCGGSVTHVRIGEGPCVIVSKVPVIKTLSLHTIPLGGETRIGALPPHITIKQLLFITLGGVMATGGVAILLALWFRLHKPKGELSLERDLLQTLIIVLLLWSTIGNALPIQGTGCDGEKAYMLLKMMFL